MHWESSPINRSASCLSGVPSVVDKVILRCSIEYSFGFWVPVVLVMYKLCHYMPVISGWGSESGGNSLKYWSCLAIPL